MGGCYALTLKNLKHLTIPIGSLGSREFEKGIYIYVGSAFGKNQSISSRVNRHVELFFSGQGSVHWHIDHLLTAERFELIGYCRFPSKTRNECKVAREIKNASEGSVEGFGCSDCGCGSHLFYQSF